MTEFGKTLPSRKSTTVIWDTPSPLYTSITYKSLFETRKYYTGGKKPRSLEIKQLSTIFRN
jgi:hypothetical protein